DHRLAGPRGRRDVGDRRDPERTRAVVPAGRALRGAEVAERRPAATVPPRLRRGRPRHRRGARARPRRPQGRAPTGHDVPGVPRPRGPPVLPLPPVTAAGDRLVWWRGLDPDRVDAASVRLESDRLDAFGSSVSADHRVTYRLATGADWAPRQLAVDLLRPDGERSLPPTRAHGRGA